jgi:hypothetical protein
LGESSELRVLWGMACLVERAWLGWGQGGRVSSGVGREGRREGGREGAEGEREGGRELRERGGREGAEGEREGGKELREGGREGDREGAEGGREGFVRARARVLFARFICACLPRWLKSTVPPLYHTQSGNGWEGVAGSMARPFS